MPKITDTEIRRLLKLGFTVRQIAMNHNLTPRRVKRVKTNGRSAHEQDRPKRPGLAFRPQKGQHLAEQPSRTYGEYWRQLKGEGPMPQLKVRRTLRMVPDDREDEAIDFDEYFEAMVAGVVGEGRRGRGRGAA